MKRVLYDDSSTFSTFELDSCKDIFGSHIYIAKKSEREIIADDIFQFINDAYDGVGGFRSFKDADRFINDSYLWYITYEGEQPSSLADFDIRKVYVVSVFRKNYGLKMVGLARRKIGPDEKNKEHNMFLRRQANSAVIEHIKFISDVGWAEVSDNLEKFFHRTLPDKCIIDPYILLDNNVFSNMQIDMDELHYSRPLRSGETPVTKIAYGNIRL